MSITWNQVSRVENSEEVRERHEANREAWNEAADAYRQSNEARVQDLRAGKSNLHEVERRNLARYGPLKDWCQRAIHLQCASGNDTLSLWLEGAHEVIGVDISDVHIANARWTTEQLNAPAQWFRSDILDTPAELNGSADLVYTGRGALCWLHDLKGWAEVIQRLLKPGGIVSVLDDHPATWLFEPDVEAPTYAGINYFGHAEWNKGWGAGYLGTLGRPVEELAKKYEQLWTMADVFQALSGAGLVVEYFGEHPESYWDMWPQMSEALKAGMPRTFSMMARRP